MWSDRRVRAAVVAGCILVGCGGPPAASVHATNANSGATAAEPAALADQYMAAAHSELVVARGCVRPEQVPRTGLVASSLICVYQRAFRGEIRVGLVDDNGTWRVIGEELVTA